MVATALRPIVAVIRFVVFLQQVAFRIFWSGLNGRTVLQLVLNFWKNFSLVFIWLLIFKNAGLIPKEVRPQIWVQFPIKMDQVLFDSALGSISTLMLSFSAAWFLAKGRQENLTSDDDEQKFNYVPSDFQDDVHHGTLALLRPVTGAEISDETRKINIKLSKHISLKGYVPYDCWELMPSILLCLSWFLLNLDNFFVKHTELAEWKDNVAWFSYVIGHFCVPLFTAIWLYVFHTPGGLKIFGVALGLQNIWGVCTHLLFPCVPPWFISLYGPDKEPNYDMPGYAAGLIRVKYATGTHLVNKGFHASPIVFGAVPSLHSAMAVLSCFFVCYYSRYATLKIFSIAFVIVQWWATIYLDHHWRLDLIVGMVYSITIFSLLRHGFFGAKLQLTRIEENFVSARLSLDFEHGSTMGMRVFRNTPWQKFFDPMSL